MTYSMIVGKYKLIFSDTHFKDFRKKPTISVYDADTNSETKIASFNSKETFEWFIELITNADRKAENSSEKPNNCEECEHWNDTEDGCADRHGCKTEPTISKMEQVDEPQTYVINPQEPTDDDKCFECDDFFTCDGQCDEIEDEPQTERSE